MELNNKKPLIICVCGKARSGKNTVCNFMYSNFQKKGYKTILSPYTKYLKKYINEISGWQESDDNNKPRELLQDISSQLIKKKLGYTNFFIERQIQDINIYSYFFDIIIIPDVRFPNEIEELRKNFKRVIAIGIERPNFDNGLTETQKNDATETSLNNYQNFDYYIVNKNNEKELFNITKEIMLDIRKKELLWIN